MDIDYTTALQNLNNQQRLDPLPFAKGYINSGGSVTEAVQGAMLFNSQMDVMSFPSDATDRYFVITEGSITGATAGASGVGNTLGNFNKVYRLPFPTTIQDTHDVKYDHNFNWLQLAKQIPFVGTIAGIAENAAKGLGYSVNNFKALTLSTPNFRNFTMEFRMFPKSRDESDMIQRMIISLKTGMHPTLVKNSAYTLFEFPNVFLMWFNTGNEYLYKFKPCVINAIQVNYQGDNPVPAFYRNPGNLAIPEGVVMRFSCIETEVWTRENFASSTNQNTGIYNSNPLSAAVSNIQGLAQ